MKKIAVGVLVQLPKTDYWWSEKIGIVVEKKRSSSFGKEGWIESESSKILWGTKTIQFTDKLITKLC